ncbi:MAG: RNA 2',3'-cyclic phosphodiesterase [Candidatus Chisholmbacteria bacterium]|nr:RNA 2',3'-cyclic phosphodiesterase [Candidatus Chisholmbacteria bacterium]
MKRRIFVGVPLSDEVRRGVSRVVKRLVQKRWPIKWEAAKKCHITVAFLGWITEVQLVQIVQIVKEAAKGFDSFAVEFKGLGAFPDLVRPRVVWLGLKGDLRPLARLYQRVRQKLEASGFELEQRPFVPHVTVGRMGREVGIKLRSEMGRQIKKLTNMDLPYEWRVDRVIVYESQMKRSGSEYRILEEIKLT